MRAHAAVLALLVSTTGCGAPTLPLSEAHAVSETGSAPEDDARHFAPPGGKVKKVLVAQGDLDGQPPEDVIVAADYVDSAGLVVASRLLVRSGPTRISEPWEIELEPAVESDEEVGFLRVGVVPVEGGKLIEVEHRFAHEGSDPREHIEGYLLLALRDGRLQGILSCPRTESLTVGPERATRTISRQISWDPTHVGRLLVRRSSSFDCGVCEESPPQPPPEPPAEGAYRIRVAGAQALADDVCRR